MPSPFPGMNPYLERPNLWAGFHNRFITHLSDTLNGGLPDAFVANVEERLYIVQEKPQIVADFAVVRRPIPDAPQEAASGATILARPQTEIMTDTPRIFYKEPKEIREPFIEIVAIGDGIESEVVCVIELLSPSNKAGEGREKYQQKQRELAQSDVHFLEIDLRLDGVAWDYLIVLHRAEQRKTATEYWPVSLDARLPCVPVPLTSGLPDVPADLQAVFSTVYDRAAYAKILTYLQPPTPSLTDAQTVWADALLSEKGVSR